MDSEYEVTKEGVQLVRHSDQKTTYCNYLYSPEIEFNI